MSSNQAIPSTIAAEHGESSVALRASWYALFIMTLIHSTHYLDRIVVSIVIEPIRHEFNLNDGQLGLLTGLAYGLTFAIAGLPLGYIVDRVNRRNLLGIIVLGWSGFTVLAGFAQNFTQLLLARMAVGAAEAGGSPTSMSMISDLFPPKKRSTAMGVLFLSTAIGAAASALIGSYVAAHYGWRAAFLIAGIPGALFALLLLLTVKEPKRGAMDAATTQERNIPSIGVTLRFLKGQKALLHLFAAMPLAIMAISAKSAWLVAFLMRNHTMSLEHASVVAGITFGGFAALGSLFGGTLSDRLSQQFARRRIGFAGVMAIAAVPFALGATLLESTWWAVSCWFVLALMCFSTIPPTFSSIVTLAKPRMRGVTLASMQVLTNLIGYGLAPFLVGLLSDRIGGPTSLRFALAIIICGSLIWAAFHYRRATVLFDKDVARALES